MDLNKVPEIKTLFWKAVDDCIMVQGEKEKFLFNTSAKAVWEKINGVDSVSEIVDKMYEEYKENYERDYVHEVVVEAINMFTENKLILLRNDNMFDGWLSYE